MLLLKYTIWSSDVKNNIHKCNVYSVMKITILQNTCPRLRWLNCSLCSKAAVLFSIQCHGKQGPDSSLQFRSSSACLYVLPHFMRNVLMDFQRCLFSDTHTWKDDLFRSVSKWSSNSVRCGCERTFWRFRQFLLSL